MDEKKNAATKEAQQSDAMPILKWRHGVLSVGAAAVPDLQLDEKKCSDSALAWDNNLLSATSSAANDKTRREPDRERSRLIGHEEPGVNVDLCKRDPSQLTDLSWLQSPDLQALETPVYGPVNYGQSMEIWNMNMEPLFMDPGPLPPDFQSTLVDALNQGNWELSDALLLEADNLSAKKPAPPVAEPPPPLQVQKVPWLFLEEDDNTPSTSTSKPGFNVLVFSGGPLSPCLSPPHHNVLQVHLLEKSMAWTISLDPQGQYLPFFQKILAIVESETELEVCPQLLKDPLCLTGADRIAQKLIPGLIITYKDIDGDLLMVGDLPWRTFVQQAKAIHVAVHDSKDAAYGCT